VSDRKLRNWLTSFVEYASHGEAPEKTLLWTGISTVAGALRRQVWIDQKFYQWTPSFYIILTAPPGIISKSTTANIGINLLREIPGIKFGPDIVTWQALLDCFESSTESYLDKSTGAYHTHSPLTLAIDEFGTLLDPSDRAFVDLLVHLWDGRRQVFQKVTKGSGQNSIENPWINMLACTTPGWLKSNFPEAMIGGGFSSRCLFVYADRKRQYVAYPARRMQPEIHQKLEDDLVHDLEIISKLVGEYKMTDEAMDWGEVWYENLRKEKRNLNEDQFGGYFARKQVHVHKLAIIIAAAQSSNLVIDLEALQIAEGLVSSLEPEMGKVFETIGQTQIGRGISELSRIVAVHRRMTKSHLYRQLSVSMGHREFEAALTSAQMAGHIKLESSQNVMYIVANDELKGE